VEFLNVAVKSKDKKLHGFHVVILQRTEKSLTNVANFPLFYHSKMCRQCRSHLRSLRIHHFVTSYRTLRWYRMAVCSH
jgi:hypothetical protein